MSPAAGETEPPPEGGATYRGSDAARRMLMIGQSSHPTEGERGRRHRRVIWRGVRVAVLVGSLLTLVNQGDRLRDGEIQGWEWWRIAANYLIPFLVSTYSGWKGASGRAAGRAAGD